MALTNCILARTANRFRSVFFSFVEIRLMDHPCDICRVGSEALSAEITEITGPAEVLPGTAIGVALRI